MNIELIASDGVSVEVSAEALELSGLLRSLRNESAQISVPNISGALLQKIGAYLSHFAGKAPPEIPKPLPTAELAGVVSAWEVQFVQTDQETLSCLLLASNFLDIAPLRDLCCAKLASELKGKTPDQIRAQFNIRNDFSPEEEEQIKQENSWCRAV